MKSADNAPAKDFERGSLELRNLELNLPASMSERTLKRADSEAPVHCQSLNLLPDLELKDWRAYEPANPERESIHKRLAELNGIYNVRISGPGEVGEYPEPNIGSLAITLRLPTKAELDIIETALEKFKHLSTRTRTRDFDFGGLTIGFAAHSEANIVKALGWYNPEKSTLYFAPENRGSGHKGLEGTALHELSHHLQKLFWKQTRREPIAPSEFAAFFGFERGLSNDGETIYRINTVDGRKWQREERQAECDDADFWYPVVGSKVERDKSKALSESQIKTLLKEAPVTDYFPDPPEAHAEALMMLLYDRKILFARNPRLYELMKHLDQLDIIKRFGSIYKFDGTREPRMIRNLEGRVVTNSPEERQRLKQEEESWAHMDLSKLKSELKDDHPPACACHKKD